MLNLVIGGLFGLVLGFIWLVMLYGRCSVRMMWGVLTVMAAGMYGAAWGIMKYFS